MAYIPVTDVASIEIFMRLAGQSIETNYAAYHPTEPPTIGDLEDLAEAVLNWVDSVLFPQLSIDLSCVGVKVTDLSTVSSPTFTATPVSAMVGDVAQPSEANSLAFVVKHLTAGRGRSYRGRSYVPGIPKTSMTDPNTVSAVLAANLLDAYNQLDTDLVAEGWGPVVISRFTGGAPRVTGVATPILNHNYTSLTIKNQRRRSPGVGS